MTPPALSPPALHFLIVDFTITCGVNQLLFVAYTDTSCHLTLHMADFAPTIRKIPYQKRGANFTLSSVTCFVEIDTIDQDEAGDTTTHTFTIPLTAYDLTHYWYLTGTQNSAPMISISQIFSQSCPEPILPPPILACYNNSDSTFPQYLNNSAACFELAYSFKPQTSYFLTKMRHLICAMPGRVPYQWTQAALYTNGSGNYPDVLIGESTIADTSGLGTSPTWVYYDFPNTFLTGAVGYWFTVMQWGQPPGMPGSLGCRIYKGKTGNCYWPIGGYYMNRYRYNPSVSGLCVRSAAWYQGQFIHTRFTTWGSFP